MDSTITEITLKLMKQTTKTTETGVVTMRAQFPRHRGGGKYYLGGAHGTFGVLYEIIQACLTINLIEANSQ